MRIPYFDNFTYGQPLEAFFHLVADVGMFCCVCLDENNLYMKSFARRYWTTMKAVDIVAAVGSVLGS